MPRVRARRKAPFTTRKRSSAKKMNLNFGRNNSSSNRNDDDSYQQQSEEEELPPVARVPRKTRKPRKSAAAAKSVPAKRRGRKVSVSSEENSDVPEDSNEDDSSEEDSNASSEEDLDANADTTYDGESEDEYGEAEVVKRTIIPRDRDPVYVQNRVYPPLVLPPSSADLIVPQELVLPALGVYEILRRFGQTLQLTPFRFEDFCCALMAEENSRLIAEIFSSIFRLIIRDCETTGLWLAPHDEKDSVYLPAYCLDSLTWPELVRSYLNSSASPDYAAGVRIVSQPAFPCVPAKDKLDLLEILCATCLRLNGAIRATLTSDYTIQHEEACRSCQRLGELICCEHCPATYHLECVTPPLKDVPEGEWVCPVCRSNQVVGVTDCNSEIQKQNLNLRQEPLGLDRHGRRFAFLARRLFVYEEDESAVWYYSSLAQFEEVLGLLDPDDLEKELCEALADLNAEITAHMETTLKLTKKSALGRPVYIEKASAAIVGERKKKEDEEQKISTSDEMDVDDGEKSDQETKKEPSSPQSSPDQPATADAASSKEDSNEGIATRTRTGALVQKTYLGSAKPATTTTTTSPAVITQVVVPFGDPAAVFDLSCYAGPTYKLGLDGSFRAYRNIFTENMLAQTRSHKAEERDRRRHLSAKYYISADRTAPGSHEFHWKGQPLGVTKILMATVKSGMMDLEKTLHPAYYHPAWAENRAAWLAAVEAADTPHKLALLLITLEASCRTMLFTTAWHETLGCIKWGQYAPPDREETRNQERRRRREEDELVSRSAKKCYVSFVLGVHHQIWKHKGEEFRLSGKGGVFWYSSRYADEVDDMPARCVTPPPLAEEERRDVIDISAAFSRCGEAAKLFPLDDAVKIQLDKMWKGIGTPLPTEEVSPVNVPELVVAPSVAVVPAEPEKPPDNTEKKVADTFGAGDTVVPDKVVETTPATSTVDAVVSAVAGKEAVKADKGKETAKTEAKKLMPLLGLMQFKKDSDMLDMYRLARSDFVGLAVDAGLHEMPGYKYDYKTSPTWEYHHFPRPNIRTAWRLRTYAVRNWGGVALQLRVMYAGLRWEEMSIKAPLNGRKVIQEEAATIHSELKEKRPAPALTVGFPRFEYLIKRVVMPLKDGNLKSNQKTTPGREGLRERRVEKATARDPYALDAWVPEEELELWEIKSYYDRIEHPVEQPKPAPMTISPATLTIPYPYHQVQKGKTPSYMVELAGKIVNGRPQFVVMPSGFNYHQKMLNSSIRIQDSKAANGQAEGSGATSGDESSVDGTDQHMSNLSGSEKNERWIKEQSERINKRMASVLKLLPQRTGSLKAIYARRQEDLQYVVFQAMVNQNPALLPLLPEEPELSPTPSPSFSATTTMTPEFPAKKRGRSKTSPRKPAACSNGVTTALPDSERPDVMPLIRIKKTLYQTPQHEQPEAVVAPVSVRPAALPDAEAAAATAAVTAGNGSRSRAKMISTAPKGPDPDAANRSPKRRGRKSNAQRMLEADEAEKQAALERANARAVEAAKAEAAAAAAASLPKIPSPMPDRNMSNKPAAAAAAFQTPLPQPPKSRKRPRSQSTTMPEDGVALAQIGEGKPREKSLSSGKNRKTSSGKAKQKRHSDVRPAVASSLDQPSSKKRRNGPKPKNNTQQQDEYEENSTDLHCYCRTPYDESKFYIGCDKCERWFHGDCVQVKENDPSIARNASWFCPDCLKAPPPTGAPLPASVAQPVQQQQQLPKPKMKSHKKKKNISESDEPVHSPPLPKLKIKIPPVLTATEPPSSPSTPRTEPQRLIIGTSKSVRPKITLKLNKKLVKAAASSDDEEEEQEADGEEGSVGEAVEEPKSSMSSGGGAVHPAAKARKSSIGGGMQGGSKSKTASKLSGVGGVRGKEETELYCLCQEPAANGYRNFIKCDKCSKWYHPRCVGLTNKKVEALSVYACPVCQKNTASIAFLRRPLIGEDWKDLQGVIADIKKSRNSGAFLEPVNPLVAPDYYIAIAEPMDFATMSGKVQSERYRTVYEFIRDAGLVFDNARTYNKEDTVYYKNAEQLEEILSN
ncbi:Nucleosome-remodeling factor subunit BPTF [Hypsibius exemplaris]|uniref:Nucleosome-remodeling factor subunit BPTF n=1 Tax=Hypsibius exemplaris TaxID=2072580 RepID=A0A1W0WXX2_HYPEX|nr:Nucleosome-remodeling factor subunit BPTF [Hypsibius exemplaris]